MKKPSRGWTILGLMIAILAIALAAAGWSYSSRREVYLQLADHHLGEMAAYEQMRWNTSQLIRVFEGGVRSRLVFPLDIQVEDSKALRAELVTYRRKAEHEWALCQKYRRAADRPWLGVERDPPSP